MFPSACTLRCTQCAALIALATAAGISRFENTPAAPSDTPAETLQSQASGGRPELAQRTARIVPWLSPVATIAAWVWSADANLANDLPAEQAPASVTAPPPLSLVARDTPPSTPRLSFSSFQRRLPYAVGPPARRGSAILLAAGTSLPGNFAATQVFPFPEVATPYPIARVARLFRPSVVVAGPAFSASLRFGFEALSCVPVSACADAPVAGASYVGAAGSGLLGRLAVNLPTSSICSLSFP